MKTMKYMTKILAAAMLFAAVFSLTACSVEEPGGQGNALPEGEYPLRLSAEVSELQTRSGGKDSWTNGDAVGIRKGEDETARYVIGADNALNPATPDQTLYWQTTDPAVIQAWYPYEAQTNVDISDQSNGYAAFDFLYAEATGSYSQSTTLLFKHQMAKVEYTLVAGDGITDADLQAAAVKVYGDTQADFTEGTVAAADQTNGEIASCKDGTDGSAIVVPQDMTGKPLLKVSTGGNDYIYTPETQTAGNLEAGKRNTYNITVHKDRIQVASASGQWNDQETTNDATEAVYRIHLSAPTNVANTSGVKVFDKNNAELTATDGVYSTSTDEITISVTPDDNYHLKSFLSKVNNGVCEEKLNYDPNSKTYSYAYYNIRSDLWIALKTEAEGDAQLAAPQAGDLFYFDGKWSTSLQEKPCIGIVFKIGAGEGDEVSNYGGKLTAIQGYVIALHDAAEGTGIWGDVSTDIEQLPNESSFTGKYNGYTNTNVVRGLSDYDQYWAFQQVDTYQNSAPAPANSSGWYLPSIGQLSDIYNLPGRADLFTSAGGTDFETSENEGRYWSSTEVDYWSAWYYRFNGNGAYHYGKDYGMWGSHCDPSYVRAVLTF